MARPVWRADNLPSGDVPPGRRSFAVPFSEGQTHRTFHWRAAEVGGVAFALGGTKALSGSSDQPVRLAAEFTAPELAQRQNGKLLLRGTFSGDDLQSLASDPERSNPLLLGVPATAREVVRLKLPPGTRAPNLPAGDQRSTPFGDFSLRWRRDRAEIVIERQLAWKQPRIRPEEVLDSIERALDRGEPFAFPGRGTALLWRVRRFVPSVLWRRIDALEGS